MIYFSKINNINNLIKTEINNKNSIYKNNNIDNNNKNSIYKNNNIDNNNKDNNKNNNIDYNNKDNNKNNNIDYNNKDNNKNSIYKYKFTTNQPYFKQEVRDILNTSGWTKSYNFIETDKNNYDIGIGLRSREYMKKNSGLVEYDINGNKIYLSRTYISTPREIEIDEDNWNYGVAISKLSIPEYRKYVINHEIGHAIGYDHRKCYNNEKCPIMYQMTKGIPNNSIPSYNVVYDDINYERPLL